MSHGLIAVVTNFRRARAGSAASVFALVAPMLLAAGGAAIDYSTMAASRTQLQGWADSAALMAARELRLGNAQAAVALQVAKNYVAGQAGKRTVSVTGSVDLLGKTISLQLSEEVPTAFAKVIGVQSSTISTGAKAKAMGGAPICMIGLDPEATHTVGLDKTATILALNCSIYSNSKAKAGLYAKSEASVKAAFTCSAGGAFKARPGSIIAEPQLNCPVLPDPLGARPMPSVGGCSTTNLVVTVPTTLYPGVYCGGLILKLGAVVTLSPGVYVMKDGPLAVTTGAVMIGKDVGFFLTGKNATFKFDELSTVTLTAPLSGDMAGLLFFEDRTAPVGQRHEISSVNARILLGTFYLPRGELYLGSNKPIADLASYTIIVANRITADAGPILVLNSNYGGSNVPVPEGVGPNGSVTLVE